MDLKSKTIVVTGGGNGIGRQLVLQLLDRDARVAAVDINEAALLETARLAGDQAKNLSTHTLSITDEAAVARLPEEIIARHGVIDGLINNAGIIQPFVKLRNLDFAVIKKVIDVNFYGTLYMIKAIMPYICERPVAMLANVASMGGFLPIPGQTAYGASKAAVKLLTEGLYAELLEKNVQVSVIFPGAIATDITANSGVEIKRSASTDAQKSKFNPMPVEKAAGIILDNLERGKNRIFVGKDAKMLNFLYSISPGYATRMVSRQMKSLLAE
jgi:short-subunit dehydrogenase